MVLWKESLTPYIEGSYSECYGNIELVPRSNHSLCHKNQLMVYKGIAALFSEIHTKHTNALCGQNIEFLSTKLGGTESNH